MPRKRFSEPFPPLSPVRSKWSPHHGDYVQGGFCSVYLVGFHLTASGTIARMHIFAIFAFFSAKLTRLLFVEPASCPSTILLTSSVNSNTSLSSFQTLDNSSNFQNDASKENRPLVLFSRIWESTQGGYHFVFHHELTIYSSLPQSHLTFLLMLWTCSNSRGEYKFGVPLGSTKLFLVCNVVKNKSNQKLLFLFSV